MKQAGRAEHHFKEDREWFAALSHALADGIGVPQQQEGPYARPELKLMSVSPSGNILEVELRFRAGKRYCCAERGCHASCSRAGWSRVRERLAEVTPREPPPMRITFHVVVEEGAELVSTMQVGGPLRSEAYSYTDGPADERQAR